MGLIKKEINHKSEEIKISSIEQLAKQLRIPDELIRHHQFLVAFKSFICSVCNNSNMLSLKDLTYRKRIDLEMPSDIYLSEYEMKMLLEEIGKLQCLKDAQVARWLEDTYVRYDEVKSHPAIVVNAEKKSVYFQNISKSGENVCRVPEIVSFERYSTDEKSNLISDSLYYYDTHSTKSRKITDSANKTLKYTSVSYDKEGKVTGTISQDGEDKENIKPATTEDLEILKSIKSFDDDER